MRGPSPLFLLIVLLLQITLSWLVWRMMSYFSGSKLGRKTLWLYSALSVAAIVSIYSGRLIKLPSGFLQGWYYDLVSMAYGWTISQAVFVVIGAVILALKWLTKKLSREKSTNGYSVSRREFLLAAAGIVPLVSLSAGFGGIYSAMRQMAVNRISLEFPHLPPQVDGFRIAQLSDLHVGPFFTLRQLERVISMVRQEQPDMLVITGDFIDELGLAEEAIQKVSHLAAEIPQGIYFCWGNHEYFRDISRIAALLEKSKIQVIDNSSRQIIGGPQPLYLAGVDYPWANNKSEQQAIRKQFITTALSDIPNNAFSLLISHHPDFIEDAFTAGIPLTLTGHTHGGQVYLLGKSLLPIQYRFMRGMYQQGDLYGYVHVGTGHWLPFRVDCPPEIAIFTLKRKMV